MQQEPLLAYERLDVYKLAIELLADAYDITKSLPKGHSSLKEQFKDAATSVALNIAEGTGRRTCADQARHYAIASGSALECGAIFDALWVLQLVTTERAAASRSRIVRIVQMLSRLFDSASAR